MRQNRGKWKKASSQSNPEHLWLEPPVLCHWATATGQPPTLTMLYIAEVVLTSLFSLSTQKKTKFLQCPWHHCDHDLWFTLHVQTCYTITDSFPIEFCTMPNITPSKWQATQIIMPFLLREWEMNPSKKFQDPAGPCLHDSTVMLIIKQSKLIPILHVLWCSAYESRYFTARPLSSRFSQHPGLVMW